MLIVLEAGVALVDRHGVVLISEAPVHHALVLAHNDIVLLDHSNALHGILLAAPLGLVLLLLVELRIFDFNLGVVENVIVIVDVLYDFNWLVLALLLWLRAASPALVSSVKPRVDVLAEVLGLGRVLVTVVARQLVTLGAVGSWLPMGRLGSFLLRLSA